jgi:hypothetical protein
LTVAPLGLSSARVAGDGRLAGGATPGSAPHSRMPKPHTRRSAEPHFPPAKPAFSTLALSFGGKRWSVFKLQECTRITNLFLEETMSSTGETHSENHDEQTETWEPGSKTGVVLLTGTFVLMALLILGDMLGFLFR